MAVTAQASTQMQTLSPVHHTSNKQKWSLVMSSLPVYNSSSTYAHFAIKYPTYRYRYKVPIICVPATSRPSIANQELANVTIACMELARINTSKLNLFSIHDKIICLISQNLKWNTIGLWHTKSEKFLSAEMGLAIYLTLFSLVVGNNYAPLREGKYN